MKKILSLFLILFGLGLIIFSQNKTISMYNPEVMNKYMKAVAQRQARFDENRKYLDQVIDWVLELKANSASNQFDKKLDKYYEELKSIYAKDLSIARTYIRAIELKIKEEKIKYNSGEYDEQKTDSNHNQNQFNKTHKHNNGYVELINLGNIRNRPDINGKVIAKTENYRYAKVIRQVKYPYYEIEFNGKRGYISEAFIRREVNKPEINTPSASSTTTTKLEDLNKKAQEGFVNKNYASARSALNEMIKVIKAPNMYFNRGLTWFYEGLYDEAISDFSEAIRLKPTDIYFYVRALSYGKINKAQNSMRDFTSCISNNPQMTNAYFARALLKSELGDLDGAIKDYDKILIYHDEAAFNEYDIVTVYNNKAYCLLRKGDYQNALSLVNKALNLNKTHAYIWDTRGEIYYHLENYKDCISDMTKALSMKETNNSYYYRGLARLELNDEAGCDDLSRAGELGMSEAYEMINRFCNK